jgi:hypothetical protein
LERGGREFVDADWWSGIVGCYPMGEEYVVEEKGDKRSYDHGL